MMAKNDGHLTKSHRFNFKISATRCVIERAFGRLKGKFSRLGYVDMAKLSDVCFEFVYLTQILPCRRSA